MKAVYSEWKSYKLAQICSIVIGKTPSRGNAAYWDVEKKTNNVWLSIADIPSATYPTISDSKEYISDTGARLCKIIKAGTLLVSFKLTIGRMAIAGRDLYSNEAIAALKNINDDLLTTKYLYWFLMYFDWKKYAKNDEKVKGITLNKAKLKEIVIKIPSRETQNRIVAILDDAFERIDKAIANTEKNIANVNELIERTIVDAVFGEPDEKSWDILPVKNLAVTAKGAVRTGPFGSQLLHSEFVDSGIAVLGIDNAVQNEFKWGKSRFITHEKYKQLIRYTVHPGDVLITIMGTCGRCAVVPDDIPTAINTKHLCCITLNKTMCTPEFLHDYFLYHPIARNYLTAKAKGAIMAGLNMEIIKMMPVALPSLSRQKSITQDIASLSGQKQALITTDQAKLASLQVLKQSLLAAAFSGELTVDFNPDALEL